MPDLDLAVIHLTFEGIQTFGGGVATVTRGHLGALPQLRRELGEHGVRLTPYFAEIAYAPDHERRDPSYQRQAEEMVAAMGGEIEYLVNFTQGHLPRAPWGVGDLGGMENWKAAAASGAAVALNWARRHERAVIYCHDSLFALAPIYIALQASAYGVDVTAIYVVHATALTHEMPLPNPERLMVESAAVHWAKVSERVRLGAISRFMSRHLIEDYGARPEHVVPTGNGINPADPHFRLRGREEIMAKLREYDIPLDRPLLFSWGRAVEYKRFDLVLEAAARLQGEIHPVIMVTPEWQVLMELRDRLGIDATLVFAFDPQLVACLLQWEGTVTAASLALNEPFGLTPAETRVHGRQKGALIVVSDTGGLAEQVEDGVDGFVTRQDDPDDVARALRHVLALSEAEKQRIRRVGLQRVLEEYTWASQILKTLAAVVPEVAAVVEPVRSWLVQENERALQN
ncbi:MAG: glycosyltransferase family 4 protein [Anaerolineae bacterium]